MSVLLLLATRCRKVSVREMPRCSSAATVTITSAAERFLGELLTLLVTLQPHAGLDIIASCGLGRLCTTCSSHPALAHSHQTAIWAPSQLADHS